MGGGPSSTQKAAQSQQLTNAQQEGGLAKQSADKFNALYGEVNPFLTSEMTNGLPFYHNLTDFDSGTTAQAYNPAKANFLRSTSTMGALPSGFRAGGMNDINEAQAHDFDSQLVGDMYNNFQTRQAGAAGKAGLMQAVNPAAFYGGSTSAAGGAAQPLQPQPNPFLGMLGGIAGGATNAAINKIPF